MRLFLMKILIVTVLIILDILWSSCVQNNNSCFIGCKNIKIHTMDSKDNLKVHNKCVLEFTRTFL